MSWPTPKFDLLRLDKADLDLFPQAEAIVARSSQLEGDGDDFPQVDLVQDEAEVEPRDPMESTVTQDPATGQETPKEWRPSATFTFLALYISLSLFLNNT